MSTPKETPVQFTLDMVRATQAGLKTQMRIVVDPQPDCGGGWEMHETDATGMWFKPRSGPVYPLVPCPLGKPGDRLWVQEEWMEAECPIDMSNAPQVIRGPVTSDRWCECTWFKDSPDPYGWPARKGWRPASSMPRWASRLTLEVSSVRVAVLQGFTEVDAAAEGVIEDFRPVADKWDLCSLYRNAYRERWVSLHGKESWDANPFVWVVEFSPIATRNEQPDFRSLCAELLTELQSMRKVIADEVGYPSPPSPLEERVGELLHNEN